MASPWIHELLATMTSLRFLAAEGLHEHVRQQESSLAAAATQVTQAELIQSSVWNLSHYGRAHTLGRELERAVGWEAVRTLIEATDPAGLQRWLASLTPDQRAEAQMVLAVESSPT